MYRLHAMFQQLSTYCLMQIHTTQQFAAAMVYAYPWTPPHKAIEMLAADRGEPTVQALLNDTSLDNLQHAANWEDVINYLTTITTDNYHGHVPLLKHAV